MCMYYTRYVFCYSIILITAIDNSTSYKNEMTLLSTRMQKSHAYVSLLILDRI